MEIKKLTDVEAEEATSKLFEGKVTRQTVTEGAQITVGHVNFSPGAKNVFHTHTTDQVLFVTEGKGIVATEKEERVVTPGTIIYFPAGERHWHGATEDSSFSHLAIKPPGETNF